MSCLEHRESLGGCGREEGSGFEASLDAPWVGMGLEFAGLSCSAEDTVGRGNLQGAGVFSWVQTAAGLIPQAPREGRGACHGQWATAPDLGSSLTSV